MTLDPGTCKISELGGIGLATSQTYNPFSPLEAGVGMDSLGLVAWDTKACTGGYSTKVAAPVSYSKKTKQHCD